jgi:hypothetical protein
LPQFIQRIGIIISTESTERFINQIFLVGDPYTSNAFIA